MEELMKPEKLPLEEVEIEKNYKYFVSKIEDDIN
jgi:hypothetical protein